MSARSRRWREMREMTREMMRELMREICEMVLKIREIMREMCEMAREIAISRAASRATARRCRSSTPT